MGSQGDMYPQSAPPTGPAPAPSTSTVGLDCAVCNHNGGNFCKGCGGTAGGFGFPPCKRCRAVIATDTLLIDCDANEGDPAVQQIIDCAGPMGPIYGE